jgi:hypothetical protein
VADRVAVAATGVAGASGAPRGRGHDRSSIEEESGYRGRHARRGMATAGFACARRAGGIGAARRVDMPTPQNKFPDGFERLPEAQLGRVSGGYSQQMFAAMQQAVGMGLTINSTTTGGHATNSMHYKGRAFDSIGTASQMQGFYNWAAANTHPHELIHKNQFLKDGQRHSPIGGHDGHVHFSI